VKVLCGNPYVHDSVPTDSTICTYSYSEASLAVAAALLATGKIPDNQPAQA
jgi:hypothetical protein